MDNLWKFLLRGECWLVKGRSFAEVEVGYFAVHPVVITGVFIEGHAGF